MTLPVLGMAGFATIAALLVYFAQEAVREAWGRGGSLWLRGWRVAPGVAFLAVGVSVLAAVLYCGLSRVW